MKNLELSRTIVHFLLKLVIFLRLKGGHLPPMTPLDPPLSHVHVLKYAANHTLYSLTPGNGDTYKITSEGRETSLHEKAT